MTLGPVILMLLGIIAAMALSTLGLTKLITYKFKAKFPDFYAIGITLTILITIILIIFWGEPIQ